MPSQQDRKLTISQARARLSDLGIEVTTRTVRDWFDSGLLQGIAVKRQ